MDITLKDKNVRGYIFAANISVYETKTNIFPHLNAQKIEKIVLFSPLSEKQFRWKHGNNIFAFLA